MVAAVAIALALIPWYSSHLQNLSLEQAEAGFQVDSLNTARNASDWNPVSVNALFLLSGVEHRVGYVVEARKTLIRATKLQPLNYATWEQLALGERNLWNMPREAEEHFARALALNPQDQELRRLAGVDGGQPDA